MKVAAVIVAAGLALLAWLRWHAPLGDPPRDRPRRP